MKPRKLTKKWKLLQVLFVFLLFCIFCLQLFVYLPAFDLFIMICIAILKSLSFILRRQYFVVFTSQIQCFDWLIRACFDSWLFSKPIKIDHHFKVKIGQNKVNTFWTNSANRNVKSWKIFVLPQNVISVTSRQISTGGMS